MQTQRTIIGYVSVLLFLTSLLNSTCNAQEVDWRYEYNTGERTIPAYFWVDREGNGFFNIMKSNPTTPGQYDRSHSLLILNKKGAYNGSVYIKHCDRGGILLPFSDDQYVMSGKDCELDGNYKRRSYLLNYDGTLVKTGRAFEGNYFAQTPSDRGFTYFSKPTKNFSHTYLSIGYIDSTFSITNDSISLAPLKRDNLGMVFNYIDPVQLKNKNWILPFNYGKVRTGISVDHGSVFCVENEQIAWQYPDTISRYKLGLIDAHENTTTVFMRTSRSADANLFVQLDENGSVLQSTAFFPRMRITDMKVNDENIILLGRSMICWFDWNGNKVREFDLNQVDVRATTMKLLSNGAIVVVGTFGPNSVVVKISSNDHVDEIVEDSIAQPVADIQYADASLEDQQLLSASVFPNPASLRINFEIKDQTSQRASYQLQVFSQSGKELFRDQFTNSFYELNLSDFVAGTYIYRIFSIGEEKTEFVSGKFVKI